MTEPGSNGGVYFHTAYQDVSWPDKGFEVQVNNTHTDPIKSGSLYHVVDIGTDVVSPIVKDNEWFTEDILVKGNTVTISLNGKQVVKWTQPAGLAGHATISPSGGSITARSRYRGTTRRAPCTTRIFRSSRCN